MIKPVTGRAVHRHWCRCQHRRRWQQWHTTDRAWLHRLITKWAKKLWLIYHVHQWKQSCLTPKTVPPHLLYAISVCIPCMSYLLLLSIFCLVGIFTMVTWRSILSFHGDQLTMQLSTELELMHICERKCEIWNLFLCARLSTVCVATDVCLYQIFKISTNVISFSLFPFLLLILFWFLKIFVVQHLFWEIRDQRKFSI